MAIRDLPTWTCTIMLAVIINTCCRAQGTTDAGAAQTTAFLAHLGAPGRGGPPAPSTLLASLVRRTRESDHCNQCGNPNAKFCCRFFQKCCELVCGEDMRPCWPPVPRSCTEERCGEAPEPCCKKSAAAAAAPDETNPPTGYPASVLPAAADVSAAGYPATGYLAPGHLAVAAVSDDVPAAGYPTTGYQAPGLPAAVADDVPAASAPAAGYPALAYTATLAARYPVLSAAEVAPSGPVTAVSRSGYPASRHSATGYPGVASAAC